MGLSSDPESVSSILQSTMFEVTLVVTVDHVGVITEDTMTALASTGLVTATAVTGDVADFGGGIVVGVVPWGGVVTIFGCK